MAKFQGFLAAVEAQARFCQENGSPFTARVLRLCADDVGRGGPVGVLAEPWASAEFKRVVDDAAALRLAGALHFMVLSGAAPDLAALYPPSHGAADDATLITAIRAVVVRRGPDLIAFLRSPPQTNEVMRSFALLPGFLTIIRETGGLPLTTLEIGASAGLNANWSRYRYEAGGWSWGDPASPVTLKGEWRGSPPLTAPAVPVEAFGADVAPVDVRDPEQALRLQAYVWPDQGERLARLKAAIAMKRDDDAPPERADAAAWTAENLHPRPGRAVVLYHSIMWQYLPPATQAATRAAIEAAGARATADAPLFHLRMEPDWSTGVHVTEVRLTAWPGGEERLIARSHPHGAWLEALEG
ncbi:DUF2332 domain-containing protein [soil metagenome]